MRLLPPTLEQSGTITLRPAGVEEPINIGKRTEARDAARPLAPCLAGLPGSDECARPRAAGRRPDREAIRLHERVGKAASSAERIVELLETVGLTAAAAGRYPTSSLAASASG